MSRYITPESRRKDEAGRTRSRREYFDRLDGEAVCEGCGSDSAIEVHHKDGDPRNTDPENLVGLCHSCHRKRHRRKQTDDRLESMEDAVDELGGSA